MEPKDVKKLPAVRACLHGIRLTKDQIEINMDEKEINVLTEEPIHLTRRLNRVEKPAPTKQLENFRKLYAA